MELKATFGFGRKLNTQEYGGKPYESIDFTCSIEVPLNDTDPLKAYESVKPTLDQLYNLMRKDALQKIRQEAGGFTTTQEAPRPFKSPFSKLRRTQ